MTLAMMHVDGARTRLPLVCTVISTLVLALVGALGFISWMLESNEPAPQTQGTQTSSAPLPSASHADASDVTDSLETEPWIRHVREF